jgi:hypothetical protein
VATRYFVSRDVSCLRCFIGKEYTPILNLCLLVCPFSRSRITSIDFGWCASLLDHVAYKLIALPGVATERALLLVIGAARAGWPFSSFPSLNILSRCLRR